mmetsp:Transcript_3135/g.11226  ORF Transcript_3135/g.11226 Transcript_3135/m.11226 type:complete len:382 (-) Transcript_3135:1476-2621(-)
MTHHEHHLAWAHIALRAALPVTVAVALAAALTAAAAAARAARGAAAGAGGVGQRRGRRLVRVHVLHLVLLEVSDEAEVLRDVRAQHAVHDVLAHLAVRRGLHAVEDAAVGAARHLEGLGHVEALEHRQVVVLDGDGRVRLDEVRVGEARVRKVVHGRGDDGREPLVEREPVLEAAALHEVVGVPHDVGGVRRVVVRVALEVALVDGAKEVHALAAVDVQPRPHARRLLGLVREPRVRSVQHRRSEHEQRRAAAQLQARDIPLERRKRGVREQLLHHGRHLVVGDVVEEHGPVRRRRRLRHRAAGQEREQRRGVGADGRQVAVGCGRAHGARPTQAHLRRHAQRAAGVWRGARRAARAAHAPRRLGRIERRAAAAAADAPAA